ncbi:hypothetical protein F441_22484 [Phytophthora nicotianae CJ01A1]|uniref:Uncharacterized protein n=1 Tax=Phytophthora nicotianae CJ01A1 TaxID=1317063 RepID=W2VR07_PHYNI|nr:hypothetical protein F441_22484 [Phytophthora nicotianae CJ01A1]
MRLASNRKSRNYSTSRLKKLMQSTIACWIEGTG